jgi:hypothetical protein
LPADHGLPDSNTAKARRIRNLKKFQIVIPKRAIILLVNSTTYGNKEIKEPELLIKTQASP